MTAGNFNVYGGIYRDVRLVRKERLHIPFQGSPETEGGTFITTPEVSHERAVVRVQTWVRNAHPDSRAARLVTRILAPDGTLVQVSATEFAAAPGVTVSIIQHLGPVPRPWLWSPDTPHLYRVESRLESAGAMVDCLTNPLGFRWFRWDASTRRLIVNGTPIVINGTNRQQEYPWLGDAMPAWLEARDIDDIRHNLAHNFMRTSHYPQAGSAYDLNDRLGLITVAEVPNIKSIRFGREIQEANARAMVRRLRNHPSIFFWSVGNETAQAADSRWIWEEDRTRIIHQRRAEQYGDYVTHDHTQLEMESLLRCTVRGWHDQDFVDSARVNPVSGQIAGTEEWQHAQACVPGGSVRGVLNEQGVAWLYADHGCDRVYENAPLRYLNPKGWVDAYREPKYIYYAWQANWLDRPMVFVHPHHWRREFIGQRKSIQVDANADEVELFAGSISLGAKPLTRENFRTARFDDVLVTDTTLRAEARRSGRVVASAQLPMAGAPARLTLEAIQNRLTADRASVAVVRVKVVDDAGHLVGGIRPTLEWFVRGPARLLTPAIYTSDAAKDRTNDGVWYTALPISTVLRTTAVPGEIYLRVTSPGLVPGEITLTSVRDVRDAAAGVLEPPLDDDGRQPVTRESGFVDRSPYRADLVPMRDYPQLGPMTPAAYREAVDQLIRMRNPAFQPLEPAYGALLDKLASRLVACDGALTEDDYNHVTALYNDCAHLYRVIGTLAHHPRYLDAWRRFLAEEAIARGTPVSVQDTHELLAGIPTRGEYAELRFVSGESHLDYERSWHVFHVHAPDLAGALTLLYPLYGSETVSRRADFEAMLRRINPWLVRPSAVQPLWAPSEGGWRVFTPPKAQSRMTP
jgi:hypothetical protein